MPRVTQQYRAARRREILDAAARCFADSGFHSTSMQDLFAASGLTAGLVYRYFRSKDELIAAIAGEALDQLHASVEQAMRASPPPTIEEVVERLLRTVDELDSRGRITRVAVQVWGEALRNREVGPIANLGIARVQASLASLVRDAQELDRVDHRVDPEYGARALLSIVTGFVVQRAMDPAMDRAPYERAARALVGGLFHAGPLTAR